MTSLNNGKCDGLILEAVKIFQKLIGFVALHSLNYYWNGIFLRVYTVSFAQKFVAPEVTFLVLPKINQTAAKK